MRNKTMKHDYVLTYCTKDKSLLVETDGVPPHSPCTFNSEQLRSLFGEVPFPERTRAERIERLEAELKELKKPKPGDIYRYPDGEEVLFCVDVALSLETFEIHLVSPDAEDAKFVRNYNDGH